jgi:sulfur-carrier protein
MVRLVYFAWVREQIGVAEEELDLPRSLITIADLAPWMATRGGGYATAFADPAKLRCALDQVIAPFSTAIGEAKEIAFFPPVTGG